MKITGIIAEYNPFHAGHAYQIAEARKQSGADAVCVILSPSWVQRGEPAVFSRSVRTRMALAGGADLVLEMPAPFATAAAPDFAFWGTSVLSRLGCDAISFGCENEDAALLIRIARIIAEEPPAFRETLRSLMKKGISYPASREEAVFAVLKKEKSFPKEAVHGILSESNNILALEYAASLIRQKSRMELLPVRRLGSGYNETALPEPGASSGADSAPFVSAMALRRKLEETASSSSSSSSASAAGALKSFLPESSLNCLASETALFPNDFSQLLQYAILRAGRSELSALCDVGEEIAGRILDTTPGERRWDDWANCLKVRQFTYTRISRALTHILLGIRAEEMQNWKSDPSSSYARILGFRRESSGALRELKKRSGIPLITKPADAARLLPASALSLFEKNAVCEHIYQSVRAEKMKKEGRSGILFENEYRSGPVILG